MKTNDPICLGREEAGKVLSALEFVVVSLDRIGSTFGNDNEMLAQKIRDFVMSGEVFKKLAATRKLIVDAYASSSDEEQLDALEKDLEKVKPWND
jgi:hypothetical protein